MKQAIEDRILCHYDYFPLFVELTDYEMQEYKAITDQLRKFIDPDTGKYKKEAEMLLLKRKRVIHKAENKKVAITNLLEDLKSQRQLDYTFVFVPEGYEPDYAEMDNYNVQDEDIHIIDEYAQMFKEHGYSYHKYISGLEDAQQVLKSFSDGDIKILLSMKCLDEGVDIPRAEHAIFCSSTGNPRQFVQRRGRVLRKSKGKEKATIWDLIVMPPDITGSASIVERNLFAGEVPRPHDHSRQPGETIALGESGCQRVRRRRNGISRFLPFLGSVLRWTLRHSHIYCHSTCPFQSAPRTQLVNWAM